MKNMRIVFKSTEEEKENMLAQRTNALRNYSKRSTVQNTQYCLKRFTKPFCIFAFNIDKNLFFVPKYKNLD